MTSLNYSFVFWNTAYFLYIARKKEKLLLICVAKANIFYLIHQQHPFCTAKC